MTAGYQSDGVFGEAAGFHRHGRGGEAVMVEVKGVARRWDWPADDIHSPHPQRHFS